MQSVLSIPDAPASIDSAHTLLAAALDPSGWICIVGLAKSKPAIQKFFRPSDYAGACSEAMRLSASGFDSYFGTSSFASDESRKADNANAVKIFKLDLDVAADNDRKYPTQKAAVLAMIAFCDKHGLPYPVFVSSGWGVHCYWILTEALDQDDGKLYSEKLKAACISNGLLMDPTVTGDIARILRVPGTMNYKVEGTPKPVQLKSDTLDLVDTDLMLAHIDRLYGIKEVPKLIRPSTPGMMDGMVIPEHLRGKQLDKMTRSMLEGKPKKFIVLLRRSLEDMGKGCAQIKDISDNQHTIDEPKWRSGLSIAQFCEDGEEAIHMISRAHPGYSEAATIAKAELIPAPHTCKNFAANWPEHCKECPHAGKITSPIQLGSEDPAQENALTLDDSATVTRLAALSKLEYDRIRTQEAKALGVRAATLDAMIEAAREERQEASKSPFVEVEPWDTPVDVAELLHALSATVRRFIVCAPEVAHAAALWAAFTWVLDAFQIAPLAIVTAPEKRCGKSEFRRLLAKLVNRPLEADGMSASVLFRGFDLWKPTLLVDEFDTFVSDDENLRGIFNAGHQRGGCIWRCVGDNHEPARFDVFGPKLLAGIGTLPGTMMDRAIIFELRRKLAHEQVERLRYADASAFDTLRRKLARFAQDHIDTLRTARPDMPEALNDRAQDNWEPLLAIADAAGGTWPELARVAALALSADKESTASMATELLSDIREVFAESNVDKLFSYQMVGELCKDERRWAAHNRGGSITTAQVARILKGFNIAPKSMRIDHGNAKGYAKEQFADAWARYLPPPSEICRHNVTGG